MIQHILARKYNHRGVALGWFHGCEMVICPSFKKMVEFTSEHRIMAIIRIPSKTPVGPRSRKTSVEFDPSDYGNEISTAL